MKHTLERPASAVQQKEMRGQHTTLLECDDCVIRVAEVNLSDVVNMIVEDPELKQLIKFFSDLIRGGVSFEDDWHDTEMAKYLLNGGRFYSR